eukprot:scaffold92017_cov77-Cyclotella_meneghiniana.AAC.1
MKLLTLILIISSPIINGFAPPSKPFSRSSVLRDVTTHINDLLVNTLLSTNLDASDAVSPLANPSAPIEASDSFAPSYSKASYYTTLALYVASFPGLWSQIKRSTTAKVKRKTYVR